MSKLSSWKTIFFLCVFSAVAAIGSPAQTFTTLFNFGYSDGSRPVGPLVQGRDGNLYGTANQGGQGILCPDPFGCGTVFRITPGGTLTTLYSFCSQTNCSDGETPYTGLLVQATDGNFYGTTSAGGTSGNGTVFKITPAGTLTTLPIFNGSNSEGLNSLVQATDGNLYGTTSGGGAYGGGTVFKLTPGGTLTTLYSFCAVAGCPDGSGPAGLVQATDGNFYGATGGGGAYGGGTVFKLTPGGTLTTLYSFCAVAGCPDGSGPAGLVQATDGNFYGATGGGAYGDGTVFKLTPGGTLTTLYSFCAQSGCPDGSGPGGLVQATNGNFYGTTASGGLTDLPILECLYVGCGTVFKITPKGMLTTLHAFDEDDGTGPQGLVQATNGNFYGTTFLGGNDSDWGTVFILAVGPAASVSPISLTFSDQHEETTSGPQPVTLSNMGDGALTITNIAASANFGETDNCNGSVAAGDSCTINVTFSPEAVGSLTGTLSITDNAGGVTGSLQAVALTGTGILTTPAGAGLSPAAWFFASQVIDTASAVRKVTLTSTGTTNLTPSISITGTNAADFSETNNCPASMAPGAKCTINLIYSPTALGADRASLTVTDTAANSPQTVPLSGTGVPPAAFSNSEVNFGNVVEKTLSTAKQITLTNNQPAALTIWSMATGSPDFRETNTCGASLPPAGHCTITLTFAPSIVGQETGKLTVYDPAANSPQIVTLTGTGILPATLSETSVNFGIVEEKSPSSAKDIILTNNQTVPLTLSRIATGNPDFTETDTCGGSAAPGGHCTISLTFTPSKVGAETGTLTVTDAAINSPQTASLLGTGK